MKKNKDILADLILPSDKEVAKETKLAKIKESNINFRKLNPWTDQDKQKRGDKMRGKTLEEIVGNERAIEGRKTRQENSKGPRPKEVVNKIVSTKKQNGVYASPTHGMNGKTHKESTKIIQAQKAQIRQDLKRGLGLGKYDVVPKELLLKEYKKYGL